MRYRIAITAFIIILIASLCRGGAIDPDKKITLRFEDVTLSSVLNIIAQQYDLNIVQSGLLGQKVSIRLDEVGLGDALKAILLSNGYNYYLTGDIVVIKPLETSAPGEMESRIITVNYLSPAAVINATSDLLSSKGKMKIIEEQAAADKSSAGPRATQIVITDLPDIVDKVAGFVKGMDRPEPQVAIEVKMIETNVTKDQKIGITWPVSLVGRGSGVENPSGSSSSSTTTTTALGQIQLPHGKWEWGRLSVDEVEAVLDFLDGSGNSKLISNPRITTLNNCEAEINVSTVIPIQTINRFSEGGSVQDIVTFQDEDVGISLLVTPHIADSNQIILDVLPTVAEITGYSGPEGNQKPITSERSVRTRISVKAGETAVLGGLLKESKIENKQRIFFLGSLPIIGGLFSHKTVENSTTDLLILITPTIVGY
jgi:type II secretory pathway component GspD/PulD (secretin)